MDLQYMCQKFVDTTVGILTNIKHEYLESKLHRLGLNAHFKNWQLSHLQKLFMNNILNISIKKETDVQPCQVPIRYTVQLHKLLNKIEKFYKAYQKIRKI